MNVVLLHAFPLDERMWEPQLPVLAAHDVTAPNLYDQGGSSVDGWAQRILDEVEGDLVAVGASMGGYVALAMARLAPERIRGLLLAGARPDADSPERRASRAEAIELIENEGAQGLWENQRDKLFGEHTPEAALELGRTMALARQVPDLIRAVEAIRDRPDSAAVLRTVPVVLAVGAGDPFLPVAEARAFAEQARSASLVVVERSRHLPNLEQPAEFNQTLLEFLSSAD